MPERLLKKTDVLNRIGYGNDTLWRLIREGRFPQPVAMGLRTRRWRESEVDSWIQAAINRATEAR